MKKTCLAIAAFLLCVSGAFAQNFNVNLGGIQWTSGPSVPASCSRDGSWFYKNVAPKGWSQCNGGFYGSGSGAAGVVYAVTTTAQAAVSGAYATVYTTPAAGLYRITSSIYPTTLSSAAWQVETAAQFTQVGATSNAGALIAATNIGTAFTYQVSSYAPVVNLAAGATIGIGTFTVSGSNTGGVFNYSVVIERLQ